MMIRKLRETNRIVTPETATYVNLEDYDDNLNGGDGDNVQN